MINKKSTSIHEVPRNTENDGDDGHAGHHVFLFTAVNIVLHFRPKSSTSIAACHFFTFPKPFFGETKIKTLLGVFGVCTWV